MHSCKNCGTSFHPYETIANCNHCDEFGQVDSTRDYGWDKDGMMKCPNCDGKKEIKRIETSFCCEHCQDEYLK